LLQEIPALVSVIVTVTMDIHIVLIAIVDVQDSRQNCKILYEKKHVDKCKIKKNEITVNCFILTFCYTICLRARASLLARMQATYVLAFILFVRT
jgi:hypothetical protein